TMSSSSSDRLAGFSVTNDSIRSRLANKASRTVSRTSGDKAANSSGVAGLSGITVRRWFTKNMSVPCNLKNSSTAWGSSNIEVLLLLLNHLLKPRNRLAVNFDGFQKHCHWPHPRTAIPVFLPVEDEF